MMVMTLMVVMRMVVMMMVVVQVMVGLSEGLLCAYYSVRLPSLLTHPNPKPNLPTVLHHHGSIVIIIREALKKTSNGKFLLRGTPRASMDGIFPKI